MRPRRTTGRRPGRRARGFEVRQPLRAGGRTGAMDRIKIRGGAELKGAIPISGAKNAALPLMIASLLTDQTLTLENLPRLADVNQLVRILGNHGVDYSIDGKRIGEEAGTGQTAHLRARTIVDTTAPYEMVAKRRASRCRAAARSAPGRWTCC